MRVNLLPEDLNLDPYLLHPTSIYTRGVTTTPRVRSDNALFFFFFFDNMHFSPFCDWPIISHSLALSSSAFRPLQFIFLLPKARKEKQLRYRN